jgi:hypothetical protein
MTIGLDFDTMYNIFSADFLKSWEFQDVFQNTKVYENAGFDTQSAQVCAYADTKIIAAAAAIFRIIEANNAKVQEDISPKS